MVLPWLVPHVWAPGREGRQAKAQEAANLRSSEAPDQAVWELSDPLHGGTVKEGLLSLGLLSQVFQGHQGHMDSIHGTWRPLCSTHLLLERRLPSRAWISFQGRPVSAAYALPDVKEPFLRANVLYELEKVRARKTIMLNMTLVVPKGYCSLSYHNPFFPEPHPFSSTKRKFFLGYPHVEGFRRVAAQKVNSEQRVIAWSLIWGYLWAQLGPST